MKNIIPKNPAFLLKTMATFSLVISLTACFGDSTASLIASVANCALGIQPSESDSAGSEFFISDGQDGTCDASVGINAVVPFAGTDE